MDESRIDRRVAVQAGGVTIGSLFRQAAVVNPGAIALVDRHREMSYAELNDRVNRLVHALAGKGVHAGDRVAVLAENRCEYVDLELAVAKLGAILACQN